MRNTQRMRITVAVVLMLVSNAAGAQLDALRSTTPQMRATVQTKLMEVKLGLSGETLQKVSAINLEYANKMQPVLERADRPIEELMEIRQIIEQKDAALKQVMSPDQFARYEATKAELKQEFEQRMLKETGGTPTSPQ